MSGQQLLCKENPAEPQITNLQQLNIHQDCLPLQKIKPDNPNL